MAKPFSLGYIYKVTPKANLSSANMLGAVMHTCAAFHSLPIFLLPGRLFG